MIAGIRKPFDEYDNESLERVWQSLFKRYNQVVKALVGNDFEVVHGGIRKLQGCCRRV